MQKQAIAQLVAVSSVVGTLAFSAVVEPVRAAGLLITASEDGYISVWKYDPPPDEGAHADELGLAVSALDVDPHWHIAFVRFDLSELPVPSPWSTASLNLRLNSCYQSDLDFDPMRYGVRVITSDWSMLELGSRNVPDLGPEIGARYLDGSRKDEPVSWDLTQGFKKYYREINRNGLAIQVTTPVRVYSVGCEFRSSESGQGPLIVINWPDVLYRLFAPLVLADSGLSGSAGMSLSGR